MSKLNEERVMEMRSKNAAGQTIESLAIEYGVSPNAARNAIKGLTWQHVEGAVARPVAPAAPTESETRFLEMFKDITPAAPAEDPIEAILRRRSAGAVIQLKENDDERTYEEDDTGSGEASSDSSVRTPHDRG